MTIRNGVKFIGTAAVATALAASWPAYSMKHMDPRAVGQRQVEALPYNIVETGRHGIEYVSGGIGLEALRRFDEYARHYGYNLKLVFTLNEGNYVDVADVSVKLKDGHGVVVLNDIADGPYLIAKVPPGRYTVSVTYDGKTRNRELNVGEGRLRTAYFRWPADSSTDVTLDPPYGGSYVERIGLNDK